MNGRSGVRRVGGRNQRGHVLPLTAVVFVALLGFTGFAIDLGSVYNARRQDQTAADAAALGAAISLGDDVDTVAQAIDLVNEALPVPLAASAFNTCGSETIAETGFIKSTTHNCISWNNRRTKVRVRVPLQVLDAGITTILGIENFNHTAYAVAGFDVIGYGNVLPFALVNGASVYECVKVGAGNVPDDLCNNNDSGNFHAIELSLYGNKDLGTTGPLCNGNSGNMLSQNIAVGADHDLSRVTGSPWFGAYRDEFENGACGVYVRPNRTKTLTGNHATDTGLGMFASGQVFSDGGPSRLNRPALYGWGRTLSASGVTNGLAGLNDDALWEFLAPGSVSALDVPLSCARDQFGGSNPYDINDSANHSGGLNIENDSQMSALPNEIEQHLIDLPRADRMLKLMERCLTHYSGYDWDDNGALLTADVRAGCEEGASTACTDPIFTRNSDASENPDLWDIQLTPRFGYVPELEESAAQLNGISTASYMSFRAVYIQRIYGGSCDVNGCDIEFDPAVNVPDYPGSPNEPDLALDYDNDADAVSAFVIPPSALPGGLGGPDATTDIGVNRFVVLIR